MKSHILTHSIDWTHLVHASVVAPYKSGEPEEEINLYVTYSLTSSLHNRLVGDGHKG